MNPNLRISGIRANDFVNAESLPRIPAGRRFGGADRDRTDDFRLARAALSQLSYSPESRSILKELWWA